jgi:hypothetical protein
MDGLKEWEVVIDGIVVRYHEKSPFSFVQASEKMMCFQ